MEVNPMPSGGLMILVAYGAQDIYLTEMDAYYIEKAKQYIACSLKRTFQRRKWRALLQFARHRRLALAIRDEIADVSCDLLC